MGRRVPGIVLGVEGPAALPDGEGQVQELAHGVTDGAGLVLGMLGHDAGVQRAHGRVVAAGAESLSGKFSHGFLEFARVVKGIFPLGCIWTEASQHMLDRTYLEDRLARTR